MRFPSARRITVRQIDGRQKYFQWLTFDAAQAGRAMASTATVSLSLFITIYFEVRRQCVATGRELHEPNRFRPRASSPSLPLPPRRSEASLRSGGGAQQRKGRYDKNFGNAILEEQHLFRVRPSGMHLSSRQLAGDAEPIANIEMDVTLDVHGILTVHRLENPHRPAHLPAHRIQIMAGSSRKRRSPAAMRFSNEAWS